MIVRAQIVFLLTTFTEESFEKASNEIRTVSRGSLRFFMTWRAACSWL